LKNFINKGIIFSFLVFVGCGYKPSTTYTTPLLGEKISTEVDIDIKNPTDSIFLKDALNDAVLSVFNAKQTTTNSDSKIKLSIISTDISPLDYDKNGYAILYRASTKIQAEITDKNDSVYTYEAKGTYDFSISNDSLLSDSLKHNAIKEAFLKALQIIEFKIANRGINDNKRDK